MTTFFERVGEVDPCIVVGHSYGGLLAATFARRYPKKMASLVLADATSPELVHAAPSTTHDCPHETPDILFDVMHRALTNRPPEARGATP